MTPFVRLDSCDDIRDMFLILLMILGVLREQEVTDMELKEIEVRKHEPSGIEYLKTRY